MPCGTWSRGGSAKAGVGGGLPHGLHDHDRIGQALELDGATRLEPLTTPAAGQRLGHFREQDLPPDGVVTQT